VKLITEGLVTYPMLHVTWIDEKAYVRLLRRTGKAYAWLYDIGEKLAVIACSSCIDGYEGVSITNAIEHFATYYYNVVVSPMASPTDVVWIEYYPDSSIFPQSYDVVSFKWRKARGLFIGRRPSWRKLYLAPKWGEPIDHNRALELLSHFEENQAGIA